MSNEVNIFEVAVKNKFRFPFKGLISVEDLWDLNVSNLDLIFKSLNSQLKEVTEESLLDIKTKENKELDIKIAIVKYIVKYKLEEQQKTLKVQENKAKKQKILEILSKKQDSTLENMSEDELKNILSELDS